MNEPQWTLVLGFVLFCAGLIVTALGIDAIQQYGPIGRLYERRIKHPMARRATWREIKRNRGRLY